MDSIVTSINIAFGNCVFLNRDSKSIENILSEKINDANIVVLPNIPNAVKVETIDVLHDKLSLEYDETNVEGTITWRPSVNGKYFVFSKFE